jgi:hypothetical protein
MPHRDRPRPPRPEETDQFAEVESGLAETILDTAARLTELVGTDGLPEGYVERRQAVVETFEAIYYAVLETVTGEGKA